MEVTWVKCGGNKWCDFFDVNLNDQHFDAMVGVYVIWHSGNGHNVVRVGQGEIKERVASHRQDPDILAFSEQGLHVTWAAVGEQYRTGIERY
ncbi:MAG: hypothetical protein ACYSR0_09995, partial [Planctomycetota bacterium]